MLTIIFFEAYSLAYFSLKKPLFRELNETEVTLLMASVRKSWMSIIIKE